MRKGKTNGIAGSRMIRPAFVISLVFFALMQGLTQETSVVIRPDSPLRRKVIPHKATMYSAVLPGLGQAYNGKYWKIPIIYGGFAGLGAMVVFYDKGYVRYRNAFHYRTDGNPATIDEFAEDLRYTSEILTSFKDSYRRQRDRFIIFMVAFYALNIIDATVDAHLLNFDVNDDLSFRFEPVGEPFLTGTFYQNQSTIGIRWSIKF